MLIDRFFYKLFLIDHQHDADTRYIGSAFPVTPNGGLLTCRHVVDKDYDPRTRRLGLFDPELRGYTFLNDPVYPIEEQLDMAFIPNALQREQGEYLPILTPDRVEIGQDVYSFGFFQAAGRMTPSQAFLSGRTVNIYRDGPSEGFLSMLLPYAIVEGMSGSPVLTYHNGPKVVGLTHGNRMQRVVAHEVMDYVGTDREYKETINRIVEFGVAYHATAIIRFLREAGVSEFVVGTGSVDIPGLED